jgi:hypothetical protein
MPAVTMPRGRRLGAQSLAGADELATRPAANPLADSRAARRAHRCTELLGMRLAARAEKIGIEDLEHWKSPWSLAATRRWFYAEYLDIKRPAWHTLPKEYLDVKTLDAENLPR